MTKFSYIFLLFAGCIASSFCQQKQPDQKEFGALLSKAQAGDAPSQVELGNRYVMGRGIHRDVGQAIVWYERAADQGNREGEYSPGHCL